MGIYTRRKRSDEMDTKDFNSGIYKQQYQYKSFFPQPVNMEWQVSDSVLVNLLSRQ